MGSSIIVAVIGVVLIAISIRGFVKEMTLLKIECEGTKIEKEEIITYNWPKILFG